MRSLAIAALLAGCDTAIDFDTDGPLPGRCGDADDHSDFGWLRDNVLDVSCASAGGCHGGVRPAGMLNLTPAQAYDQLVNIPALEAGWVRVVPGDPAHSYLMVKIGAAAGPLRDGGLMPPSAPPLCAQKVGALERWIAEGAARGIPDAGEI